MSLVSKIPLSVVLGAAPIGAGPHAKFPTVETAQAFIDAWKSFGGKSIDTARGYSPSAPGSSEALLGKIKIGAQNLAIDTKVVSFVPGSHKYENIKASVKDSLEALGVDKVRIMYLHAPDRSTPFAETLKAINEAYHEGAFEKFGLSNYTAEQVEQIVKICQEHNYVLPTVYQGQYNGIARKGEVGLFPTLRKHGIAFFAYSPGAGGFFSGKYSKDVTPEDSRAGKGGVLSSMFASSYFKDGLYEAMDQLKSVAPTTSGFEVALRWICYHSYLSVEHGDAIIIGASSSNQMEQNLTYLAKGPLDDKVVEAMEEIWTKVEADAPAYHF